jgi:hypothetical protein
MSSPIIIAPPSGSIQYLPPAANCLYRGLRNSVRVALLQSTDESTSPPTIAPSVWANPAPYTTWTEQYQGTETQTPNGFAVAFDNSWNTNYDPALGSLLYAAVATDGGFGSCVISIYSFNWFDNGVGIAGWSAAITTLNFPFIANQIIAGLWLASRNDGNLALMFQTAPQPFTLSTDHHLFVQYYNITTNTWSTAFEIDPTTGVGTSTGPEGQYLFAFPDTVIGNNPNVVGVCYLHTDTNPANVIANYVTVDPAGIISTPVSTGILNPYTSNTPNLANTSYFLRIADGEPQLPYTPSGPPYNLVIIHGGPLSDMPPNPWFNEAVFTSGTANIEFIDEGTFGVWGIYVTSLPTTIHAGVAYKSANAWPASLQSIISPFPGVSGSGPFIITEDSVVGGKWLTTLIPVTGFPFIYQVADFYIPVATTPPVTSKNNYAYYARS